MLPETLPGDPLRRFVELHDTLNRDRGFLGDASPLRFAAMAAVTCPGDADVVAAALRATADEIKSRSRWFGGLRSPLRFVVSALLLPSGDSARAFLEEVERVRRIFRRRRLRRAGIYETMAILILRQQQDLEPVPEAAVRRFRALYEQMKRHQWWLTGPEDFPACAILVAEDGSPEDIGRRIEAIYQALRRRGCSKGDPLQTAANLLHVACAETRTLADRYQRLSEGFRDAGVSIWKSDYDELAILSFLDHPASRVVDRVLDHRREIASLRPKPDRSLTFNLAAGIVFLELAPLDGQLKAIIDAKAMMDLQAIIAARQSAAAASSG